MEIAQLKGIELIEVKFPIAICGPSKVIEEISINALF